MAHIALALLLLGGAYWAALPWIDCMRATHLLMSFCTVGTSPPFPGGGVGWSLLAGVVYLLAALWVVFRLRLA